LQLKCFFSFFYFKNNLGILFIVRGKEEINQTTLKYENEKIVFNNRIADNDSFDSVYEQENGRSVDQSESNE
jgi:hypothetical protein